MHIELRSHTIELTPELRETLTRRAEFALDRFADRIARVTVWLADVNGPKGGLANECNVAVDLRGRGSVFIREIHENAQQAGSRALERSGRAVARELGKLGKRSGSDRASLRYEATQEPV
jgi:ribosome-associated translation inhibitor RaiA